MKIETHSHLKGRVYSRPGSIEEDDLWTVADVYMDTTSHEAHVVLRSNDGETVEVPVAHLRHPFWRECD